ncbi:MAG: DEAD/DEAH box helicase [Lachnospiraceae bacterium]|nr:DEAD/DEAH box helicase [Lachnospiraceae bacterium]
MRLSDYFRSFTEEELANGAELFFSGDKAKISYEDHPEQRKLSGIYASSNLVPLGGTTEVKGKFEERDRRGRAYIAKSSIRVHTGKGLICETNCNCEDYAEDRYGCAHVAALLTAMMVRDHGEDVFYGTRLETLLKNMSNTDDPFQPGVLKRTDDRILSLLRGNREPALPVWKESVKKHTGLMNVECTLLVKQGMMLLEITAGTGRLYQIKDLPEFLSAYSKGEVYSLGRKEYVIEKGAFEPFGMKVLDFLAGLQIAADKGMYRNGLFVSENGRGYRYINLYGREFDNFMELLEGGNVQFLGAGSLRVELGRKGLKALMRKKAYGANLEVAPVNVLWSTASWLYLYDSQGIFRVGIGSTEKAQELLSLLNWTDPLYIRESDIGTVCRNLLPYFQEYGEVVTKGMDLEDYEREQPKFLFELDYSGNRVLSCLPYAVYPKEDFRCHLYDSETQAGRRNASAEEAVSNVLQSIFQTLDPKSHIVYSTPSEDELFDFMRERLPQLEAMGTVMATDALKLRRVRYLPKVTVGVSVEQGKLLLSLKATDLSQEEIAEILNSYRQKKRFYRLRSGEYMSLEEKGSDAWDTLSELFHSYGKDDPERFKVPAFRAIYLQEMLDKRDDALLEGSDSYRDLLLSMTDTDGSNSEVPAELKGIIRPYQSEGYRWIKMLKHCGFGGILADDMGLGKTLQVISFILSEKEDGKRGDELRTLVICPASLVYNWQREIETFTKNLSVAVIAGTAAGRKEMIEGAADADVWITSYDLLKRDIGLYEGIHFANEIIDEAQFIKNQNTQAAQSVRVVDSSFRMALTGTPIENHLSELWSILDYLMPGFLYSYHRFQKDFESPIVSDKDEAILDRLRRLVHPFILRRLKKQVLKDLPDKLEEVVTVKLDGEQRRLYDANAERIRQTLGSMKDDEYRTGKLQILAELTKLRQVCCDPSLLYEGYKAESAKLEACMQLINQAIEGGHKLLLFSQFTTMLDIIGERLKKSGISYHRIDGSVGKEKRMEMVDSFANDDVPVFCISLKAGGTGLNLTAADIVIHYDPWWNQAAQDQATDRTHRIGQTQRVSVYELIARDTIEERIQKIKDSKSKLVEDVLSGGEISSTKINREEMLSLLS